LDATDAWGYASPVQYRSTIFLRLCGWVPMPEIITEERAPIDPPAVTVTQVRRQFRLRTILLAMALGAVPMAGVYYELLEPLSLFPLLFCGGVAGGIALGAALGPGRVWPRYVGAMSSAGIMTTSVAVVAVNLEAPGAASLGPALWAGAVMFVPAAIAGAVVCLCSEIYRQRLQTFPVPRSRKSRP
jgi:peptidoglycan/LPS O-acetylase OafA/YrhL